MLRNRKALIPICYRRAIAPPTGEDTGGNERKQWLILFDGGRVPADLRLFSVKDLSVDEAVLTGESIPVQKYVDALDNPNLSPGDQVNMCFSGTFITKGRGRGIVVATGGQTLLGQIAHVMQETKKIAPPIMRKIATFTKLIIIVCISFGIINLTLGTFLGYEWIYMLLATVGVIVAMIPEGLAGAIIAAFAVGAIAMSRRNALIKRLPAAETLGCTTVICSDKTGTLTKNEMTVIRVYSGGKDYRVSGVGYEPHGEFFFEDKGIKAFEENHKCLTETLRAGWHCSNCALEKTDNGHSIKGDPTEGALVVCAAKADLKNNLPRLDEIPFNSELMYMGTLHKREDGHVIYVKGSPEKVMDMCQNQLTDVGLNPLNREATLAKVSEMAQEALRVIGIAYKYVGTEHESLDTEHLHNMTFLGLQGMIDHPGRKP